MFLFDTTPLLYHTFWSLSRTFLKYFYFSQPLLSQWIFILTCFFISVNMFSYLFLCSFGWAKKKNLDVAKISFLHFINKNGERGIWTLAPVTRPTPLAGAPLQPLEYFSSILNILYQYLIMRLSWRKFIIHKLYHIVNSFFHIFYFTVTIRYCTQVVCHEVFSCRLCMKITSLHAPKSMQLILCA